MGFHSSNTCRLRNSLESNQITGILWRREISFLPLWTDRWRRPTDNEKAEVSEHKGIIANILALGSWPMQLCKNKIQTLNPFDQIQEENGGPSITESSKEMEHVNAEKSLPFRIFALLNFLPQTMFMLRDKVLLRNERGKKEDSHPEGIIAMISELIQTLKKTIQTLRDLNKFQLENENGKKKDSQPKGISAMISELIQTLKKTIQTLMDLKELQKENDQLRNELEWRRARNKTDDITLDAGTAHPNLCIAGDKKSLKYEAQPQKVPPHPERFDSTVCVLGSEGFSSGKHYWEVDVGSSTYWDLGVARKSIERKGKISLSPKQGFWALSLNGGDYWAKTDPWTRIMVQKKPKKIGVYLGYQDRQVTFFSVTDMSVLFTFNDCSFSGEVYPFFKNSHKGTTMRISSIKEEEYI